MSTINIVKADIAQVDVDAIVNAANEGLRAGGGVCGAIFRAAGREKLQAACDAIGHCNTGEAVITPGFALKARYVIHAVGPVWYGGNRDEPKLLADCYTRSLELAAANGCKSIAFPLISSGIFKYPKEAAWRIAISTCLREQERLEQRAPDIIFCVINDDALALGKRVLSETLI